MSKEKKNQEPVAETDTPDEDNRIMSVTFLIMGITWIFMGLTTEDLRVAFTPLGLSFLIIALIYNPSFQWTSKKPKKDKKAPSGITEEEPKN